MKPLDKFGEFLVANLRDIAIDKVEAMLSGRQLAPGLKSLQSDLERLTPEQRAVVRRCVIKAVDSGLHDFLFALGEAHDGEKEITIVVDGQDLAVLSDGLHGEPYGERGWYARFSKHGPQADQA